MVASVTSIMRHQIVAIGSWYVPFSPERIFFIPDLFAKTCRSDVLSSGQMFRSYISTVGKLRYILYCFAALLQIAHNGKRCKEAFGFVSKIFG